MIKDVLGDLYTYLKQRKKMIVIYLIVINADHNIIMVLTVKTELNLSRKNSILKRLVGIVFQYCLARCELYGI